MADKQTTLDPELDELYANSSPSGKAEPKKEGAKPKESVDEEAAEESEHTAMVPKRILQGRPGEEVHEGDEIVVRVVKVYDDDDVEIQYAPKRKAGKGEKTPDEEIDEMDNPERSSY